MPRGRRMRRLPLESLEPRLALTGDLAFAHSLHEFGEQASFTANGDLDLDGRTDWVYLGNSGLSSMLRTEDGFRHEAIGASPMNVRGLKVADWNGDGWADLIVVGLESLSVYTNQGAGDSGWLGFGDAISHAGTIDELADVDGDGLLDALVFSTTDDGNQAFAVRLQRDGRLAPLGVLYQSNDRPFSRQVGDINGDGLADVTLLVETNDVIGIRLEVYLADGPGGFAEAVVTTNFDLTGVTGDIDLLDFDADGIMDLVVEYYSVEAEDPDADVVILRGDGSGDFTESEPLATFDSIQGYPDDYHVADLNGDEFRDVVITHSGAHWHVGRSPEAIVAYFGTQDGFDGGHTVTQYFGSSPDTEILELASLNPSTLVEDVDGDGVDEVSIAFRQRAIATFDVQVDSLFSSSHVHAGSPTEDPAFMPQTTCCIGPDYREDRLEFAEWLNLDVNSDGVPEWLQLRIGWPPASHLSVASVDAAGAVTRLQDLVFGSDEQPVFLHRIHVLPGDLNSDGAIDLVIGEPTFEGTADPGPVHDVIAMPQAFLNRGDGRFDYAPDFYLESDTVMLPAIVPDLDVDGFGDRIIQRTFVSEAGAITQNLQFDYGTAETDFSQLVRNQVQSFADVDLDGLDDVISSSDGEITITFGSPERENSSVVLNGWATEFGEILVTDLDGDAINDIVYKDINFGLRYFRGLGNREFEAVPVGQFIRGVPILATDFDADGDTDLVLATEDELYFVSNVLRPVEPVEPPDGDFSSDGVRDAADIDLLAAAIRAEDSSDEFDVNGDEVVDAADHQHWIVELVNTRLGDANLDGSVNFADFLALSAGFGSGTAESPASWSDGDFNGDGEVGFDDFLILSGNFGFEQE